MSYKEDFKRMYDELFDDDLIEENKRKALREKRSKEAREDTGL